MVGVLVSFWDGLFSGAMLVSVRVLAFLVDPNNNGPLKTCWRYGNLYIPSLLHSVSDGVWWFVGVYWAQSHFSTRMVVFWRIFLEKAIGCIPRCSMQLECLPTFTIHRAYGILTVAVIKLIPLVGKHQPLGISMMRTLHRLGHRVENLERTKLQKSWESKGPTHPHNATLNPLK